WRDTAQAAAFINPRDESIKTLVSRALSGKLEAKALPPNVVRAARVLEEVAAAQVTYAPDPSLPFGKSSIDFVSFPPETLGRKTGDCDDLTVLAAAALEAAGVATRLVTTPGHVFLAFNSGV